MSEVPETVKTKKKLGKHISIERASKQSWNTHRAGMAQRVGVKNKDINYLKKSLNSNHNQCQIVYFIE